MKLKKIICFILCFVMTFSLLGLSDLYAASKDLETNPLIDLGFNTSGDGLTDQAERAQEQPFGNDSTALNSVVEEYIATINGTTLNRSLYGDSTFTADPLYKVVNDTAVKYIKTAAVDLISEDLDKYLAAETQKQSVAELRYREETDDSGNVTSSDLSLAIVTPVADGYNTLGGDATDEVLVATFSEQLISDYSTGHNYMNLTAGDYDNDGTSEIVVYVPDLNDPHLALYEIEDGEIADMPETFSFTADQFWYQGADSFNSNKPSKYVYMASGDITGDYIDDLAVSYNMPEDNHGSVFIFKSQDFAFGDCAVPVPDDVNNPPQTVETDTAYIIRHYIGNAAVTIGNIYKPGNYGDGLNELIIAGFGSSDRYSTVYSAWRYPIDKEGSITGQFNEVMKANGTFRDDYGLTAETGNQSIFTILTYVFTGDTIPYIYLNGCMINTGESVSCVSAYTNDNPEIKKIRYTDYGVIAGNFSGNEYGDGSLRILREREDFVAEIDPVTNDETRTWVKRGLEIVAYGRHTSKNVIDRPIVVNGDYAAIAAPDTDIDSYIMRYVGYELVYSDPVVLAVLASPPYFKDLVNLDGGDSYIGGSSTEFTSGQGGSTSDTYTNTVEVGAFATFETGFDIAAYKLSVETEFEYNYSYTWSTEHETEVETSITYGTIGGQDSVALYTIPMDVYTYEVWCPPMDGNEGYWQTLKEHIPYPAAYTVVSVEKYDQVARRVGLPVVGNKVLTHTLGYPETYPKSSNAMYNAFGIIENPKNVLVGYGSSYNSQSITIKKTTMNTVEYEDEVSFKLGVKLGGGILAESTVGVGATAGYKKGAGKSTASFENTGFTGTVHSMPSGAEDLGYLYEWKLVEYTYTDSETGMSFPVLNYAIPAVNRPPVLPDDFEAGGSTSGSITLQWKNTDPNVTGFKIYRYFDFDDRLAGYYQLSSDLPAGATTYTDTGLSAYTNYKYKIQALGSKYRQNVSGIFCSVLSGAVTGRTKVNGDQPVFTTQPESITVAAGNQAQFTVVVSPAATAVQTEKLYYQWQKYSDENTWGSIAGKNSATLDFSGITESNMGKYRCAVSQQVGTQAITVYSDTATVTVAKTEPVLTLQITPDTKSVDFGEAMALTAAFSGTQSFVPTGSMTYYITCYPDPTPVYNEDGSFNKIVHPDPVVSYYSVPIDNDSTQTALRWSPRTYGSYDIYAAYVGDDNYASCCSETLGLYCADSTADASALRITGFDGAALTYGDIADLGVSVVSGGNITELAQDITFAVTDTSGSATSGLTILEKEGGMPQLKASGAGTYRITAEYTYGGNTLQATKNVTARRAELAVRADDQTREINTANLNFTIGVTDGELKFSDTLDDLFTCTCGATQSSEAGEYTIFVDSIDTITTLDGASSEEISTPNPVLGNYAITDLENGILTVTDSSAGEPTVSTTGVSLNASTLNLTVGGGASTLTATVLPSNSTNKNVTWSSSDTGVAMVTGGTITPVAAGSAVITVTTADGGYRKTCLVTVSSGGGTSSGGSSSGGSAMTYYTVTAVQSMGGTITLPATSVKSGGSETVTVKPDDGYTIKNVLINGVSVGAVTNYTISNITAEQTVTAVFESIWTNPFSDVLKGAWYYDNVRFANETGRMNGTGSDKFEPNSTLTRGMFVTVLHRMSGDSGIYTNIFSDIATGAWYEEAATWAAANSIASGVREGHFDPDGYITREQLAVMLYNYSKYKGYDISAGEDVDLSSYGDAENISEYAIIAMNWACRAEILNGDDNGNLNAKGNATRAETAAMLMRFTKNVVV